MCVFGLTSFYLVVGRGLDEGVAQLVEHWSDYRKSFLGNFIRICLKIEQNYGLFLDIFFQRDNEWFVHDFYIQAQGGSQMCLSAAKLVHSGELFWDTPSWLSAWVSVFSAWRMDLNKGVPTLFAYCEKLIWKIFFKFKQGTCPWMAFAWNFFRIFLIFFRGVCGANHL